MPRYGTQADADDDLKAGGCGWCLICFALFLVALALFY